MHKIRVLTGIFITLAFLLVACQPAGQTEPAPGDAQLAGTDWLLTSLNGQPPLEETSITVSFEDTEVVGNAGCNEYGGTYTATPDGALIVSEVVQTEQACLEPEGVMEQESAYVEALNGAAGYSISGDQLAIQNAAGETVLEFTRQ